MPNLSQHALMKRMYTFLERMDARQQAQDDAPDQACAVQLPALGGSRTVDLPQATVRLRMDVDGAAVAYDFSAPPTPVRALTRDVLPADLIDGAVAVRSAIVEVPAGTTTIHLSGTGSTVYLSIFTEGDE